MKNVILTLQHKGLSLLLCGVILLQLAACGTLLYPERRGQSKGELDPVIVTLDAIGLLFFILPGVAAFIIDFNTGAIYLPAGKGSQQRLDKIREGFKGARLEPGSDGSMIVRVDPALLTPEAVETVGQILGGDTFSLRHPDLQVRLLDDEGGAIMPAATWATASFQRAQFSM